MSRRQVLTLSWNITVVGMYPWEMASVHRDPRGKSHYWYCAFTLPNGKRAYRSTKCRDRTAALRICLAWEAASQKAGRGELIESQARSVIDQILEAAGESPTHKETIREFLTDWAAGKKLSTSKSTSGQYARSIAGLLAILGDRGDKSLGSLNTRDVQRYIDSRIAQGVSTSTIRIDLAGLRAALNFARKQGLIVINPAEAVELPRGGKGQERGVFTHNQLQALLAHTTGEWRLAVLLGYFTGARLRDVTRLTWKNIDLDEGVLFFHQIKTDRRVEVPLHSDLKDQLLLLRAQPRTGEFLMPHLAKTAVAGHGGLSEQFFKIMERAGIDRRRVQSSKHRHFSQLSFHALRHSFASNLANAGVPPDLRMRLTGHRSIDVHRRYTHLELAPLVQAIGSLPSLKQNP